MKTTRRQKSLIAVFLIGLVGLVVDRTFLRPQGGAAPASADADALLGESVVLMDNVPVLEEEPPEPGLAERLNRLPTKDSVDFERMQDAFSLAAPWFGDTAASTKAVMGPVERFVRTHRLTAVVVDGQDSYVLIDDRFLGLGQQIDGFVLASVGDRRAIFERDGEQACLELVNK